MDLPARWNAARHFVERHVEEGRGDRVALACADRRVRYAELYETTARVGNALRGLGVEMEQRVLLVMQDVPEMVASFFGAIAIGAVPVPVNTFLRTADYRFFLEDSRAKVAIVSEAFLDELGPALAEARHLRAVVVLGSPRPGQLAFDALVAVAEPRLEIADTSRDDVAFWLYSSGSTGTPKGAVHLQHDMFVCAESYARGVLGMTAEDRVLSAAKLFFAYGLGNAGYFPLHVGAEAALCPTRATPEGMFQLIDRHHPTLFFAVPTLYAGMLQIEDTSGFDGSSLRLCVSAGESLPPGLFRRWRDRFGVEILDGIGTTEVLHIFLSNRPGHVRPGSSGTPVPGYEVAVVDEHGLPVDDGVVGTLRVRGDSTMAYYWNQHERTKQVLHGSWLDTGDKYSRDADGHFWYAGRADDMLKVGGIWVSPIEVENTLASHDAVLEVAVVGVEDEDRLVKPKAFVVLRAGTEPSPELADALREHVRGSIAHFKAPRWIEFVPELPKTATGKIQRFRLR